MSQPSRTWAARFFVLLVSVHLWSWPQQSLAAPSPADVLDHSLKGDSFSASPIGFKAAVRFIADLGYQPHVLRTPHGKTLTASDTVIFFDPTIHATMSRERDVALRSYLESDATLVLTLPKRYAAQMDLTGRELLQTGFVYDRQVSQVLENFGISASVERAIDLETFGLWNLEPEAEFLQAIAGVPEDCEPLLGDDRFSVVLRSKRENGAPLYIVSDSDLFTNYGLELADNAAILQWLLRESVQLDGELYIDEAFHGYLSTYSPFYAASHFPGLLLTLQLMLLGALVFWRRYGQTRFDRPEVVVVSDSSQSLAESAGKLLSANLQPVQNLKRYRDLVVHAALESSGGQRLQSDDDRIQHLEALRSTSVPLAELDLTLRSLSPRAREAETLRLARAYQRWFSEVTDGTA